MWNPRVAHYGSLCVSLAVLLVIARRQWFFGDDWSILAPGLDANVMGSHGGHWTLVPALLFPALRNLVGLDSYFPFLLLALASHLTVAHLLWRVLNRIGVPAWGATAASFLVMLLGAGAENILWAFQFGFMGAIAVGLGVLLLLDSEHLSVPKIVGVVVLAIIAPMFSGTAIPVLVAAAVVGSLRHGWWRTALLFLPTLATYLTWYLSFEIGSPAAPGGISSLGSAGFALVYAVAMVPGGLGRALPWIGLGVIPAVAVFVWFFATVRRGIRGAALPAYALMVGEITFVLLTAYARSGFGLSAAAAQRYAYVTIVLLLPAMSVLVARLVAGRKRLTTVAVVGVLCLVGFNTGTLEVSGEAQAQREAGSERRVDASYEKVVNGTPTAKELAAPADPIWAVDLTGNDLRTLALDGQFTPARAPRVP